MATAGTYLGVSLDRIVAQFKMARILMLAKHPEDLPAEKETGIFPRDNQYDECKHLFAFNYIALSPYILSFRIHEVFAGLIFMAVLGV